MIYVIGILYFIYDKRHIISAAFGMLFIIVSAFINVILLDYLSLIIWTSVNGVIVAYSIQAEICKVQKQRIKSRNRHR